MGKQKEEKETSRDFDYLVGFVDNVMANPAVWEIIKMSSLCGISSCEKSIYIARWVMNWN